MPLLELHVRFLIKKKDSTALGTVAKRRAPLTLLAGGGTPGGRHFEYLFKEMGRIMSDFTTVDGQTRTAFHTL